MRPGGKENGIVFGFSEEEQSINYKLQRFAGIWYISKGQCRAILVSYYTIFPDILIS